jgi:hypothetical protein
MQKCNLHFSEALFITLRNSKATDGKQPGEHMAKSLSPSRRVHEAIAKLFLRAQISFNPEARNDKVSMQISSFFGCRYGYRFVGEVSRRFTRTIGNNISL